MYGQANYGPQFGQGTQKPIPSAYQQHMQAPPPSPPPPPPPTLQFQQGPTTQLPSVVQQAPLAVPPQISQLGPRLYHHGLPAQNAHQIRPSVSPMHGPPEMLRSPQPHGALPPPPPPPPPSQGQTPYRATLHPLPPNPGGMQGLRHIPPPPPPSTSGFFTPTRFGSSVPSIIGDSHVSSTAPPPPSSSPPIPPSPPLAASPLASSSSANPGASNLSDHSDLSSSYNKHSISELRVVDHVDRGIALKDVRLNALVHDGSQNLDARSVCEVGSVAGDGFDGTARLNLPPPPPKITEFKGDDFSSQPNHLMVSAGCTSPADSDMEMEDDITVFDKDQELSNSVEASDCNSDLVCKEQDVKYQLHGQQISLEGHLVNHASSEKVISGSLNLHEESKDLRSSSNQINRSGSPFRLLQDYASDDTSENGDEPFHEDSNPLTVPLSVTVGPSRSQKVTVSHLKTDTVSESPQRSKKAKKGFGQLSESSISQKAAEYPPVSQTKVEDAQADIASTTSGKTDECLDDDHRKQASVKHTSSKKVALGDADVEVISKRNKTVKENREKETKFESAAPLKVDEFGRLVREGSSDSDYDSRHTNRRTKRGRSRSSSRSPVDRSRRRNSWRRREKRSRSRSWSPRNRRSRSRSPTYRRTGEFGGENMRRDRARLPECFDFRKGKCYRGASCRYMHHEVDKSDGSRRHRSSQNVRYTMKDKNTYWEREDVTKDNLQSTVSDHGDKLIDSDLIGRGSRQLSATASDEGMIPEKSAEPTPQIPHDLKFQEVLETQTHTPKSFGDTSQNVFAFRETSVHQSQSNISPKKFSNSEPSSDTISSTQSLPSASSLSQKRSSEPISLQLLTSKELSSPNYSVANTLHHLLRHPPPASLPLAHGSAAAHMPQFQREHGSISQTASYPLPSAPVENLHTFQAPLSSQYSQPSRPPNSSWSSLLPPPPPRPNDSSLNAGITKPDVSSQFQQSHFPVRTDFSPLTSVRPYPTELPSNSQVGEFLHRAYPSVQESQRPNINREDFRSGNPPSQPFGGCSPLRDDHLTHPVVQESNSLSCLGQGSLNRQHVPSSKELPVNRILPFSGGIFPSGEHIKSSSQSHHCTHNQQPSYGMQYPPNDNILGMPGKTVSVSRYPPDLMDRNSTSCHPEFGASTISAHYNPFGSTFEQPLNTKFSSNDFSQENGAQYGNKYDTPSSLSHVAVDGHGVGSTASRQTSSPSSTRARGSILPKSGGDQYDPLFDSIETSSKSLKENDTGQKQELASDSDVIARLSGSHKPLNVEENNKDKEVGAVASTSSLDNDEYGETADAEVGFVENESPSTPVEEATAGEVEIDHTNSPGESKKKKDSRSMKLFKISIANFVKEVLKPSWRQGNMSKEAFKTIVKKTVDKVSGAMKNHQAPKSQAKINHYIDSSQRKLTKLVMGYVDKYVKV
ncbi:uncharacterized protein LOC107419036 isoform X1 [Ziziphus jujuba]|uniref:Uncharacterized protein LOC107419036 isoform X1 n=1 Tax=Ziziphus jujuba TaxID=326968 RepID=A0ABM3IIB5_ZIZJJ|nr:uncharacterized protein LOC107419036 isoform X1 [Ziziphus jujuba]